MNPKCINMLTFITVIKGPLYVIPGFDVGELSDDGPDDLEGLDASVAHIANLLSTEPVDGN